MKAVSVDVAGVGLKHCRDNGVLVQDRNAGAGSGTVDLLIFHTGRRDIARKAAQCRELVGCRNVHAPARGQQRIVGKARRWRIKETATGRRQATQRGSTVRLDIHGGRAAGGVIAMLVLSLDHQNLAVWRKFIGQRCSGDSGPADEIVVGHAPYLVTPTGRSKLAGSSSLVLGCLMDIKSLVDLAINEDPRAPCLWVPSEHWLDFLAAVDRRPNRIGAVIYRDKTIRDGGPQTDVMTGSDQGGMRRR